MDFLEGLKNAPNRAVDVINGGGVVIFPTDTVYGFLAAADNKKAVEKIYKIKKRPRSKPLPVFVKDLKTAKNLAEINKSQEKIIKKHWPGKFTFVLKRKLGTKLYGVDKKTIALRIPKYKLLNNLLKKIKKPLVQTSVNISGKPSLSEISDIVKTFEKSKIKPDLIIYDKNLSRRQSRRGSSTSSGPKVKPSIIINLSGDKIKILRP